MAVTTDDYYVDNRLDVTDFCDEYSFPGARLAVEHSYNKYYKSEKKPTTEYHVYHDYKISLKPFETRSAHVCYFFFYESYKYLRIVGKNQTVFTSN